MRSPYSNDAHHIRIVSYLQFIYIGQTQARLRNLISVRCGVQHVRARPTKNDMDPNLDTVVPNPDVMARVLKVVAANQRIPADSVTLDSTFEELKMDSLDGVNLVFAVEEEFDISIPDDAAKSLRNVREVVDGVTALLGQKRSAEPA